MEVVVVAADNGAELIQEQEALCRTLGEKERNLLRIASNHSPYDESLYATAWAAHEELLVAQAGLASLEKQYPNVRRFVPTWSNFVQRLFTEQDQHCMEVHGPEFNLASYWDVSNTSYYVSSSQLGLPWATQIQIATDSWVYYPQQSFTPQPSPPAPTPGPGLSVAELKKKTVEEGGVAFNTDGDIIAQLPDGDFSTWAKPFGTELTDGMYILRSAGSANNLCGPQMPLDEGIAAPGTDPTTGYWTPEQHKSFTDWLDYGCPYGAGRDSPSWLRDVKFFFTEMDKHCMRANGPMLNLGSYGEAVQNSQIIYDQVSVGDMPLRAPQRPLLTGGAAGASIPGSYGEPDMWEEEKIHMFSTWMHSDHPYGANLDEYAEPTPLIKIPQDTFVRREFTDLRDNYKYQYALFMKGYQIIQEREATEVWSYDSIGRIHGLPEPWYCTHGSLEFAPWHRPYVMLVETAVRDAAEQWLVETNAQSDPNWPLWAQAMQEVRFPFWDWGMSDQNDGTLPIEFLDTQTVEILVPNSSPQTIPNPLFSKYESQSKPIHYEGLIVGRGQRWIDVPQKSGETAVQNFDAMAEYNGYYAQFFREQMIRCMHLTEWRDFATTAVSSEAMETPHNNGHVSIGGIPFNLPGSKYLHGQKRFGAMTANQVTGFDPLFFLHHSQVERLLAIWQRAQNFEHDWVDNDNDVQPFRVQEEIVILVPEGESLTLNLSSENVVMPHTSSTSFAKSVGVKPGWRLVSVDGKKAGGNVVELQKLLASANNAIEAFPVIFELEPRQRSYEYYRDFTKFGYSYPMLEEFKDRPPQELRDAFIAKYLALGVPAPAKEFETSLVMNLRRDVLPGTFAIYLFKFPKDHFTTEAGDKLHDHVAQELEGKDDGISAGASFKAEHRIGHTHLFSGGPECDNCGNVKWAKVSITVNYESMPKPGETFWAVLVNASDGSTEYLGKAEASQVRVVKRSAKTGEVVESVDTFVGCVKANHYGHHTVYPAEPTKACPHAAKAKAVKAAKAKKKRVEPLEVEERKDAGEDEKRSSREAKDAAVKSEDAVVKEDAAAKTKREEKDAAACCGCVVS